MQKNIYVLFFFLLFTLISSCKKDPTKVILGDYKGVYYTKSYSGPNSNINEYSDHYARLTSVSTDLYHIEVFPDDTYTNSIKNYSYHNTIEQCDSFAPGAYLTVLQLYNCDSIHVYHSESMSAGSGSYTGFKGMKIK